MGRWEWRSRKNFVTARIMWLKKKALQHFFEISKYADGKSEIISEWEMVRELNWRLEKVELDSYEREGTTRKLLKFYIGDWDDSVVLSTSYTWVAKSIIYSLASYVNGWNDLKWELVLSLYISKNKNKNVWIKHDGEDLKNTFDWDEDIKAKTKAILTTDWEFVKYDTKELDKRIDTELVPAINVACGNLETELEEVEKNPKIKEDAKKEEDEDSLPF